MSDDIEKQKKIYHGELSGSMDGLHAGTYISQLVERLADLRKEREKDQEEILSLVDEAVDHFSGILDQIKGIDMALEATAKLKKLHEQGKLDLADPIHLALFETAKFDPAKYDSQEGSSQFTKHAETLEEARRKLVDKANEIANSNDPNLLKDERFHRLKQEFNQIKDAHRADHLSFHKDILRVAKDENFNNTFIAEKHDKAVLNAAISGADADFKPELKGMAKQQFAVAASNFDFGELETEQTLTATTVDEDNGLKATETTTASFVQKSTFDFG